MSNPQPENGLELQLESHWPVTAATRPLAVNQFVLSGSPPSQNGAQTDGSHTLILGYLARPLIVNADQGRAFVREAQGRVDVEVVGAFVMTTDRLRELQQVIGVHLRMLREQE